MKKFLTALHKHIIFIAIVLSFAAASFAFAPMTANAAGPGTYYKNDVAVINAIIENNGLPLTPAFESGSTIPADWSTTGTVSWSEDATNKRITRLSFLNLSHRGYSISGELDVSGLTALQFLHCAYGQLTSLDVSGLTALQSLYCDYNNLTSLDVSGLTALTSLECSFNNLSSLNVSGTALRTLRCRNNNLTSLNVDGLTALDTLVCNYNRLTSLNVSGLTSLENLHCDHNYMTDRSKVIGATGAVYFDPQQAADFKAASVVTGVPNSVAVGTPLTLTGTVLPVDATNKSIEWSRADGDNPTGATVTDGVFRATTPGVAYVTATIRNGKAGSGTAAVADFTQNFAIIVQGVTIYNTFDIAAVNRIISENSLAITPAATDGASVPSNWNGIVTWSSDTANKRVVGLKFAYNTVSGETLNLSGLSALTHLDCHGNQLTELEVSHNPALKELLCYANRLTALDVSKNPALTTLSCYQNQLTDLDVSKNPALTIFSCSQNRLTDLDVSVNTELSALYCSNNQLKTLDVRNNIKLKGLSCGANKLTSLDVRQNTELSSLTCNDNQLEALDVRQNTKLEELECGGNLLTSLNVSANTLLESLKCSSNQLSTLDVSANTVLETLRCSSNLLTGLDLSKNTIIRDISCDNNRLTGLDVSKSTAGYVLLNCAYNYMPNKSAVIGIDENGWGDLRSRLFEPQHDSLFNAVLNITGAPNQAVIGNPLALSGRVLPSDATNQTIVWSVSDPGTTGATITGGVFLATGGGQAVVKATITNGLASNKNFEKEFTIKAIPTYALTVTGGTGDGNFVQGTPVTLTASAAPAGQRFKEWSITPSVTFTDGTNAASPTARFAMPAQAVTAAAVYEALPTYALAVEGGTGSGSYYAGQNVSVTADDASAGRRFKEWRITPSVMFMDGTNAASQTAKFAMPAQAVAAAAVYEDAAPGDVPTPSPLPSPTPSPSPTPVPLAPPSPVVNPISGDKISGGGGAPNGKVEISLPDGTKKETTADANGNWSGSLPGVSNMAYITIIIYDANGTPLGGPQTIMLKVKATSIKTLPSVYLVAGKSVTLPATVQPFGASEKSFVWKSASSSIVKVNNTSTGKITAGAKAAGKSTRLTVTSKDGSKKAYCTVYVVKKAVTLKSASIKQTGTIGLLSGKTLQIKPTLNAKNATGIVPAFKSSNPKVAVVDKVGIITALAKGKTTITVTAGRHRKTFVLQVGNVSATKYTLNKTTYTLAKGKTYTLNAKTWTPADTDLRMLTWTSNNPKAVTVTTSGKIMAKAKGRATITAKTWNGKIAKCVVTVK